MSISDLTYLPDYSSKEGSERLIAHIRAHWEARRLPAPEFTMVRAVKSKYDTERCPVYAIRSDMVNGLPREEYERITGRRP